MGQIMVPTSQAEAPVGEGGNNVFPKGSWTGVIDEVRVRDFPDFVTPHQGYESEDGEVLSIQFGSNSPLDGQAECGESKHFVDFVVRDGEVDGASVDLGATESANWQLQRGIRLLANLGIALGQTEEVEFEGEMMTAVDGEFLENLQAGEFTGSEVSFVVTHRNWTSGEKSGVNVGTREFLQAV